MNMNKETRTESLVIESELLMEEILSKHNILQAVERVESNKGSCGIDGMKFQELRPYLRRNWRDIRRQLIRGQYKPKPVKKVEIPKPQGGIRKLGIPTVVDRFIQQAINQILQKYWDQTFSESSYGFRPGLNAHQAIRKSQEYVKDGYSTVVDIDLEKFFDRVNHDILMSKVEKRIKDKRVVKLIRSFLKSGILENGLVQNTEEGTPQGGPLSPILSNLMLDELDRELERRGHRFVRYADDCNIYTKSRTAGKRVMHSVTKFLEGKLKLKVNKEKSAVGRPRERKFLGFVINGGSAAKRAISPESLKKFKQRIRELTGRNQGKSLEQLVRNLKPYLIGWGHYYCFCETRSVLVKLDSWIRRRLRCIVWKQWGRRGYRELRKRGIDQYLAWCTSKSAHRPWRLSHTPALNMALPSSYFNSIDLPRLSDLLIT